MKKVLSVLLASATALTALGGLAACGDDTPKLTVWAPTAAIDGYKSMIADFKADYPEYAGYEINFTPVDEGEAATKLNTDASNGADVFFFEAGQIVNLSDKNVLRNLGQDYTAKIKERDEEQWYDWIIDEETGNAVAFPTTSDNGWFMWYDSTFFSDTDVLSLDTMLEKAKAANKNILFKYDDGWYMPTFHFGVGCKMDYEGSTYKTDINNDAGKAAATAAYNYLAPSKNTMKDPTKKCIITASDLNSAVGTGFQDGSVVAAFQGTWIAKDVKTKMATATGGRTYDDIKCTKNPTFTVTLNGEKQQKPMGAFMAGKYCGVNAKKKGGNMELAMAFANYMTSEKGQTIRYQTSNAGPTNKNVLATDEVKSDKAIQAVRAQQQSCGYVQLQQSSKFWDSWATFGKGIYAGTTNPIKLMTELDALAEAIKQ